MVDYLPICKEVVRSLEFLNSRRMLHLTVKYVPSWFPGAGFKRKAAHWKEVNHRMEHRPFNAVKDALVRPTCIL